MSEFALYNVRGKIEAKLEELSPSFVPEVKLTFIARLPGNDDADLIITEDDMGELKKVIERRMEADEK